MKKIACFILLFSSATTAGAQQNTFIRNLLQRMTLDEKIGQLNLLTSDMDVTGPFMKENYKQDILSGACGAIFNAYTPQYTRQLQNMAMQTRLKIPLLFGYDVIHGHKTIFPIPLGEACTWDMALMEKSARIAAEEASADGLHWTFSPMVDIARDPRWGRVAEGVGEDTWYGMQAAKAKVKGYQGSDLAANNTILACVKHFALYGAAEAGRDYNTVDMSRRQMYQFYLPPYKAAIEAGVATVMTSFNEVDGIPATGNYWLLSELLRKEWGFRGFVVTDYTSINEMIPHGIVKNEYEAGELALKAGVDMDMQGGIYAGQLKKLVQNKKISMQEIDRAVTRVLEAKYKLGLFSDPYRYCDSQRAAAQIMSPAHLQAAREIAQRSIVLLKNSNNLLPLKKGAHVALIGPLADSKKDMIGNWSAAGDHKKAVTLREALQERVNLAYAQGANITGDTGLLKKLNITDTGRTDEMLQAAVEIARKAEVVVLALGESQGMSGEAASRSDIGLPANQRRLLEAILGAGKPVVLVLMNGRPLTLEWENAHVPAILETWFLGTQAGHAIADVLLGDYNPSGKITMTFPRNVGQVPIYYNHKNTGRPLDPNNKYTSKYLDVSNEPLYPFGYGLSYTTFAYDNLRLDKNSMRLRDKLRVSVTVTNSGALDGEEVVQLYIQDVTASVNRPVKELKGFQKIMLRKGESREVVFNITAEDLKFYDRNMQYTAEPGAFKVFVGTNSRDVAEAVFELQ
ncbi:beta-glucosidase BglX [Chitinophaga alhagiae]|uniref:beta-glucosidase n=1 Tax=Chitinophaga alhagiae TaxID=2203219 RepID=A0ABN5LSJ3_9BACT|nr:beta-glucosidase BglX [Chitinophaga alhagiae]AWO02204.1 beta-glucosidase BglX [Chitinophaga alhagiae]